MAKKCSLCGMFSAYPRPRSHSRLRAARQADRTECALRLLKDKSQTKYQALEKGHLQLSTEIVDETKTPG